MRNNIPLPLLFLERTLAYVKRVALPDKAAFVAVLKQVAERVGKASSLIGLRLAWNMSETFC